MATSTPKRSLDELARLANDILERRIQPFLIPEDLGKLIAIAVDEGDFQIDQNDYTAVAQLLSRHPKAEIWLARTGDRATYRIGSFR